MKHNLKHWLVAALILAATLPAPAPALAAEPGPAPVSATVHSPLLIPLRAAAAELRASIEWDGDRTVTMQQFGWTLVHRIGESTLTLNGRPVDLGQPSVAVAGRTLVPVEPLAAALEVDADELFAKAFLRAMVTGAAGDFAYQFSEPLKSGAFTSANLAQLPAAFLPYGPLQGITVLGHTKNAVHHSTEAAVRFQAVEMRAFLRFTPDGLIDDVHMSPAMPPVPVGEQPDYVDPEAFTEQEVVVGEAPWQLPGTLAMPKGDGPFPAVVLVHGSGPHDRDETIYGVKVFRDLAQGLASRGVAVLRYEKRTLQHSQKFAALPFTLEEESVADALAAVKLLSTTPGIDPSRIVVVGHSLGGYVLPRIIAGDEAGLIAGGVSLAGPNDALGTLAWQARQAAARGETTAEQAAFMELQMAILKDPQFDPAKPPANYLLGTPLYWADYRPLAGEALKESTVPLLLLQGERDFQVAASELDGWQASLGDRPGVTVKLYPKLNHLFAEGEGPVGMMEYLKPANVAPYVVADIAEWVKAR